MTHPHAPGHRGDAPGHPGRDEAGPKSLLVFGAGGRLGRTLVHEALRRGHRVRAAVHRTDPLAPHPHLDVVRGDVHAPDTLDGHFTDIDTVLATLGSAGAPRPDVAGTGARVLTKLMTDHDLTRLVTVTGSGAILPGEQVTGHHAIKRDQMALGAPQLLVDGDRHLAILASSELDWTTIRVPFMTREHSATDNHLFSEAAFHPRTTVPYRSAAAAMLDLAITGSWSRTSPFVANRAASSPSAISRRSSIDI